jgi:hypothetical protein
MAWLPAERRLSQVTDSSVAESLAHCKTVGSASVGSNPTPATNCENTP